MKKATRLWLLCDSILTHRCLWQSSGHAGIPRPCKALLLPPAAIRTKPRFREDPPPEDLYGETAYRFTIEERFVSPRPAGPRAPAYIPAGHSATNATKYSITASSPERFFSPRIATQYEAPAMTFSPAGRKMMQLGMPKLSRFTLK